MLATASFSIAAHLHFALSDSLIFQMRLPYLSP
jgi:hypothetical protein